MRYIVATAFLLASLYPACGQEDISIKTINQIKRAVVPIVGGYTDENNRLQVVEVVGTGFFIDRNGRFLTAGHVLDAWDQISATKHPCFPAFYIPDHGWKMFEVKIDFQWFKFVECQKDSTVDLAVCLPVENPFVSKRVLKENVAVVSFDLHTWPEGTPVAFTGFPLESKTPVTSKGDIAGSSSINEVTPGFDYSIDRVAWPGASGSPLYLGNGKVVGIMRAAGQNQGSGISYARSAAVISDFLTKHPYTAKQPQ